MKLSIRKQMLTAAIATILAGPAWAATETNNQPENVPLTTGTESDASMTSGSSRSDTSGGALDSNTETDLTGSSTAAQSTNSSDTTSGASRSKTSDGALDSDTSATSMGTSAGSMDSSDTTAGASRSNTSGGALESDTSAGWLGDDTTSTTGAAGVAGSNRMADNPLYSRTATEMDGTDVVDATGNKIGEVDKVVLSQDRRSAHAVISVGGLLGLGARDVAVSFDELHMVDDDTMRINATKAELESRPEYRSEQYVEVEGNEAISGSITDFAAFEADRNSTTGTGVSSGTDSTTSQ